MRKPKQYNLFNKIRVALRDVYRYSPMRKEAIKLAVEHKENGEPFFYCPICEKTWPIQMADVDHEPPLGPMDTWDSSQTTSVAVWTYRLFHSDVQVICKLCHKRKTAAQRKKVSK